MAMSKQRRAELREFYKAYKDLRILRGVLLGLCWLIAIIPVFIVAVLHNIFEWLDDFINYQVQNFMWKVIDTITDWYARLRNYPTPPDVESSVLVKKPCYPQDCDPDCPGELVEEPLPVPPRLVIIDGSHTETDEEYKARTGRTP